MLKNSETGEMIETHPAGVFVFIGLSPNTEQVRGLLDLDFGGFIKTDASLMTSLTGVFAAGDVRESSTNQAASAAGEGAAVALAGGRPSRKMPAAELREMLAA